MDARPVNLLVSLDDPRFAPDVVHHAIEPLDREGIRIERDHRAPESILAWIDAEFGGVWSSEVAASGVWTARDADGLLGFAAYDARGIGFHWLKHWRDEDGVAVFGPFGVVPRARQKGLGRILLAAAMFSLRERGYRRALVPIVRAPDLIAYYEREAGAQVVESVDLGRRGRRWRATVLASGSGSNFQAVVDGARAGTLPLEVTSLVVNRAGAFALERARTAGVPDEAVLWARGSESRDDYDARVLDAVARTNPELVLLLGWMHVLPAPFVARFPQTLNLHPAFLPLDPQADAVTMPDGHLQPAFRGARAVDEALAAGARWIGATVHRLGVAVDRGEVLARAPLALRPGESREALDARLHALEHRVLATAIRRWSWEQR